MKNQTKTKEQLIGELAELRKRNAELEKSKAEYKKMVQSLQESKEKHRNIAELITDGIITLDLKGVVSSANNSFLELTGFPRDKIIGRHFSKLPTLRVNDIPGYIKLFSSMIMGKIPEPFEFLWIHKDGTERWGEGYFYFLRRGRKKVGIQAILKDITDRKKAEAALHESEEKFRLLSEQNLMGIIIIQDGLVKYVNKVASQITEYSIEEALDWKPNEFGKLFHPDDLEFVMEQAQKKQEGAKDVVTHYSYRIITKTGKVKWIDQYSKTITLAEKYADLITIIDITERKKIAEEKERLQAQLVQSEKMAGIGTLTSGIAHEFNNMLQIMSGHAEFARRTKKPEDMEEALNIVESTSDRVSKIIKDLLAFSSREPLERKLCNIAELVEFVLSMTEEQLKKQNIAVMREFRKTPNVEVNKGELQQVFLNMVTNARDAMLPKGGKLEVGIKKVKDNVEISFKDTGIGIEEENLGRVFEPFYTTKGAAGGDEKIQGIGLGLSVSYGIVERHGGTIEVESEVGMRTTFTIRLPIKAEKAKKRIVKEKRKVKTKETKSMNVLVVDDEEEICKMITKWLSAEGHRVKSALNGEKALQQIKKEQFDVVFLDVIMPGIPSLIVIEEIKKISPKTKIVMITGRMLDKEFKKELKDKGAPGFIQKPFELEDILGFLK